MKEQVKSFLKKLLGACLIVMPSFYIFAYAFDRTYFYVLDLDMYMSPSSGLISLGKPQLLHLLGINFFILLFVSIFLVLIGIKLFKNN